MKEHDTVWDSNGSTSCNSIRTLPYEQCILCDSRGVTIYIGLTDCIFNAPGTWSIKKCPSKNCGLMWLDPMPLKEDILKAYQGYYTHRSCGTSRPLLPRKRLSNFLDSCYLLRKYGYGKRDYLTLKQCLGFYRSIQPFKSAALDLRIMYLKAKPAGRLLEIGSGSGDSLKALMEVGWVAEGVDFDPQAVQNAKTKGLQVRQGTVEEQKYSDNCFDAVTMSHLIEHVYDPLHLLNECRRILKPGGRMVIVTPNINSIGHKFFGSAWLHLDPPRHLHLFSPQALSSLMGKAGFQNYRLFTTIREANNVFIASKDIKFSGRYAWGGRQSFLMKKIAKIIGLLEWTFLTFSPLAGEEIVLLAEK